MYYGYKLDIKHDGDFYHTRPYNIVLHENEQEAVRLIMQALEEVYNTYSTSRDYLLFIKEHIGKFLAAYHSSNVVSYQDRRYEDIWFVRQGELFKFDFHLDNGNQHIRIYPYEVKVEMSDGAVFLNENIKLGY